MPSKIQICNVALARLGAEEIRAFDENNKRARLCDKTFDLSVKFLLSRFDWSFARSFVKLTAAADGTVTTPSGVYAYLLPADCEAVRDLYPRYSKQWWERVGAYMHCYLGPTSEVYIYYTSSNIVVSRFTSEFSHLVGTYMAAILCPGITQDRDLTSHLRKEFLYVENEAWANDANNSGSEHIVSDLEQQASSFVYPDGYIEPDPYSRQ